VATTETATADGRTEYPHNVCTPGIVGGRPRVGGTRLSVALIASLWHRGADAAELLDTYPDLTPAALHSALAYSYAHQDEIDANRPEHLLRALRSDSALTEITPGTFEGRRPFSAARP
jgi:uncharacterized protein (DUF433 family)